MVGASREVLGPVKCVAISVSLDVVNNALPTAVGATGDRLPILAESRIGAGAPIVPGELLGIRAVEHRDLHHLLAQERRRGAVVEELANLVEPQCRPPPSSTVRRPRTEPVALRAIIRPSSSTWQSN